LKSSLADLPIERFGRLGSEVWIVDSTPSTNDVALSRIAAEGPDRSEGFVVVANTQTAGRGRRGHSWFSPPASGLYVTVVLAPIRASDPRRATLLLTIAAGVAIAEAIDASTGLTVRLKWPNDLQIDGRKLGGILAEGATDGESIASVALGYGLNVRAGAYPPDLEDRATSIERELGREVDRRDVLIETLTSLGRRYEDLLAGRFDAILDAWRRRAPGASGTRVATGGRHGTTVGIDDDGALLVRIDGRIERIVGGDVEWS
jgi:BirA family transcriptional regulator, biotin operon repressor / biotin---[acetyl-CoA-carboxylase] ligase